MAANTNENPQQGISAEKLFMLDAPEFAVRFRNGPKIFRHVFRRIAAADWVAYYDATVVEDATQDGGAARSFYQDEASLILFDRIILRVEGYQTRDGRAPEALPTWPECIPLNHRLHAIKLLVANYAGIATDTFEIGADGESVSFVAVRAEDSMAQQFFGVIHRFCAPTADHRQRFLRAKSQWPSSARAFATLYDELAVSADGYSVTGVPIAPEQLNREMILPHKMYAVAALLMSFGDCGPEPRKVKPVTLPPDLFGIKTPAPAMRVEMH